jgi:hypothetical protein
MVALAVVECSLLSQAHQLHMLVVEVVEQIIQHHQLVVQVELVVAALEPLIQLGELEPQTLAVAVVEMA